MLEGWKDVRAGEEVLCGWRASLNGRAQRGREQRVGRRFWARRFSPVERVFTGERVGPEGAEREMAPSSLAVDARTGWTERFSVTSRLQKSATSGEILSTVTRVSRCVKNSAAGNDILTELFFVSSRHHPVRASAHPRQYQFSRPRFSLFLCLSVFTYLFIRYSLFAPAGKIDGGISTTDIAGRVDFFGRSGMVESLPGRVVQRNGFRARKGGFHG